MEDEGLENPTTTAAAAHEFSDDIDSCCSTPYVSAPSSPGRGTPLSGFYYSAPTSPTHFIISTTNVIKSHPYAAAAGDANSSFEFDFSATFPSTGASSPESMTSADELFFNGQIRPMKLSTHLQRPQILAPLLESENDVVEEDETLFSRGRDLKNLRAAGSLRRRTRSMSPLRSNASTSFQWREDDDVASKTENTEDDSVDKNGKNSDGTNETTPCASRSSSSRRWIFLKDFLYRSKSEGGRTESHNNNKFWGSLSFSPVKDKKMQQQSVNNNNNQEVKKKSMNKNGGGKSRTAKMNSQSPHEIHYTAKRAQAEEMRKKTYLPYRQGLFGCLGFSSKSYGAINGFARALNTVSSR